MTAHRDADLVIDDPVRAATLLRSGGLVALPTETVYGLAADVTDHVAIERVFDVKGRPRGHPLILHVASPERVGDWVTDVPDAASILAERCWPGPLTLVLPRGPRVPDSVTGGRATVGIRVPAHPMTTAVLERVDGVVAPSANRFGRVSPTSVTHVLNDLADRLVPGRDAVLDGGDCPVGVESTIVDCTVDPPQVLRPGGIPTEDVHRLLEGRLGPTSGPSRASGMLVAHYAPRRPLHLVEHDADLEREVERLRSAGRRVHVLADESDLVVTARELYRRLRTADDDNNNNDNNDDDNDVIVARLPPPHGLGHAVRDRLSKAAAGSGGRT